MTGLDEHEVWTAARLERDNPQWLVMWGYHTRLYWAYPRFRARPGTIIAAPDTDALLDRMHGAELDAHARD